MTIYVWSTEQFEEMSWHDNHVHAFRIVKGEYGSGQLILDLDYILEWVNDDSGGMRFRIIAATLMFEGVTNLRMVLDYETPTAGLCPFSLNGIERRIEARERYDALLWTLDINWPAGEITFEADGFEQRGIAQPVLTVDQFLNPEDRIT